MKTIIGNQTPSPSDHGGLVLELDHARFLVGGDLGVRRLYGRIGVPARRERHLTANDTSLGVMRYADAGYEASREEVERSGIGWVSL